MNWPVFDFVTACLVMGMGIGTDVAIATVLRARQLKTTRTILYWIIGGVVNAHPLSDDWLFADIL